MIRVLRLLCLLVVLLSAAGCALPLASETELEIESAKQFEQMRANTLVSNDTSLRSYIYCVASAIIAQLEEPYASKNWEIEVFEQDDTVNAFAMPGGKIGVFTGIMKVAVNQNQLGAVLGHEVAHVTLQHSLERVNREMTTQIGVIGATAAMGGGQGTYDLIAMGAQVGLSLPYGRGQESEADVIGLQYMADAGFDPRASVELWKNMAKENKSAPPEWFSTHPSSENRIDDLIADLPEALSRYNAARADGRTPQCAP